MKFNLALCIRENNWCCVYLEKDARRVSYTRRNVLIRFVDLEKDFDRVPKKVLVWTMRKKGIPEVLIRSVMSLYEGAKTRVRVDSELSEEFEVKVEMHQGSVLSPFPLTVVVDIVTDLARKVVLRWLQYADDLIQMSDTIAGLRYKNGRRHLRARVWKLTLEKLRKFTVAASQWVALQK